MSQQVSPLFDLHIYPNPFTDKINIMLADTRSSPVEVRIEDSAGNLVKSKSFEKSGKGVSLNVSSLSPGIYLLKCKIKYSVHFTEIVKF